MEDPANTLDRFFTLHPAVALALSGGTDSSFLLYEAVRRGARVKAFYIKTPFQPRFEEEDARRIAQQLGVTVETLHYNVLEQSEVADNGEARCYHCKKTMFTLLQNRSRAEGYETVIEGTNASDRYEDRPGMRALSELGIHSPLREAGVTKETVRRLSREAGLFTWNKPDYACLATRIPEGRMITVHELQKVERAEETLAAMGYTDFRVRLLGEAAQLQLPEEQLTRAIGQRRAILDRLRGTFTTVLLDLKTR